MYKLIVSDLDGTLLNDKSEITPAVKEAVAAAEKAGVKFALCSGRSFQSLEYFERELGIHTQGHYGIGFNGAMVYETDTHKILLEHHLNRDLALEIIRATKKEGAAPLVYIGGSLVAEDPTAEVYAYQDKSRITVKIIPNFNDMPDGVFKVILRDDPAFLQRLYQDIQPMVEGRCNIVFSDPHLLEFCALEAHKGAGLRFLYESLGIRREETAAIGDQDNDTTMIQEAGLGVAVANAIPKIKALADVVLDSTNNESAISELVKQYIL